MRLIRLHDCPPSPWKNGGGSTRQLLIHPAGASLDDFLYRISVADVASDGPFSHFPGVDRSLAILQGEGITLHHGDQPFATLQTGQPPLAFDGELPLNSTRLNGPVRDFNVMSRRSAAQHDCQQQQLAAGRHALTMPACSMLFVADGQLRIGSTLLQAMDAVWLEAPAELALDCLTATTLLMTRLTLGTASHD